MSYMEGKYVSGGKDRPFLYDLYDFEKIQEEIRKKGFAQRISEIIKEGFEKDWDLKKIESELGRAKFFKELQEISSLIRSSKKKKEPRDENN